MLWIAVIGGLPAGQLRALGRAPEVDLHSNVWKHLSFPNTSLYNPLSELSLYQADFVPGVNFQIVTFLLQARSNPAG